MGIVNPRPGNLIHVSTFAGLWTGMGKSDGARRLFGVPLNCDIPEVRAWAAYEDNPESSAVLLKTLP